MFKKYHVDAKYIKCLLEWLGKLEPLLFIVAFIVHKILGIVEFGIETDKNVFIIGIITNLRKCHLQFDNLDTSINLLVKTNPSFLVV
jgi:hypothetical protein